MSHGYHPIVVTPAATAPIVESDGRMRLHFQRFIAAVGDLASVMLHDGAVTAESSFVIDGIPADRDFVRINFDLTFSSDGASLYLTGRAAGVAVTPNSWAKPYNDGAATFISTGNVSDTQVVIAQAVQADASTGGVHGEITISAIQGAGYKRVGGWVTHFDGSRERANLIAGRIDTGSPLTGLSLAPSAGTISGIVRVEAR